MSTSKRSRQRGPDPTAASALPPAKRVKIVKTAQHSASGLGFLTDERQRSGRTLQAKITNGDDNSHLSRVDESRAAISGEAAADDDAEDSEEIDDSENDSEVSSSSEEPSIDVEEHVADVSMTNGDASHDAPDVDDETELDAMDVSNGTRTNGLGISNAQKVNGNIDSDAEQDENTAPSFGEMLQITHPEIIDVTSSLNDSQTHNRALLSAGGSRGLQAPSARSLGTVLSQALRTNDKELLEACLQTKDTATIKSTIQRLQSPLVAVFMQKLAERLHKRPGRAGPLMVWVQWSLVAHGGYLAGQPQVVKKLKALRQVVKERAGCLQPLITLKGKLDMLSAQVELRQAIRAQHADADDSDDSDDDAVPFVAVDDVSDSSDEEDENNMKLLTNKIRSSNGRAGAKDLVAQQGDSDDMDGDIPIINGIDEDAEMESLAEEDDDEDQANGGFIDDQADESEGEESLSSQDEASDSASDDEADDHDDSSSSEDDVPAAPQARSSRPVRRAALMGKR